MSSSLAIDMPLGWLCAHIIFLQDVMLVAIETSFFISTWQAVDVPIPKLYQPIILFWLLRNKILNLSIAHISFSQCERKKSCAWLD